MGNGHNVLPEKVNLSLRIAADIAKPLEVRVETKVEREQTQKSQGGQLLDREWNNSQAARQRQNLTKIVDNTADALNLRETKSQTKHQDNVAKHQDNLLSHQDNLPRHLNHALKNLNHSLKNLDHLPKHLNHSLKNLDNPSKYLDHSSKHLDKQSKHLDNFLNKHAEAKQNLLKHSWESLINTAREHPDFQFVDKSADKIWRQVKDLSEFRSVEVYVKGKAETRVTSTFGELLVRLERSGGKVETFINTLPPAQREVFRARYQLLQTFGAHELFAGKGVDLNRSGDFPVRVFLSQQGASRDLPISTVINLLRGALPETARDIDLTTSAGVMLLENAVTINGGQFLFNTQSAAMLSLSLSLYQNIEAFLPLADAAPEVLPPTDVSGEMLPQTELSAETLFAVPKFGIQNASETFGGATPQIEPEGEHLPIVSLLNGAVVTTEKSQKEELRAVNLWTGGGEVNRAAFSAGATGALMSATIGYATATAEKSVGEVLGFAAGIVVGLRSDGLRTFGADSLICLCRNDLNGFLSGATPMGLNAAPEFYSVS